MRDPLGIEIESLLPLTWVFEIVIPVSWLFLGVASVVRFRRSWGEERQRVKGFAYAMVLVIFYSFADILFVRDLPP
jgi:hypothetical protein